MSNRQHFIQWKSESSFDIFPLCGRINVQEKFSCCVTTTGCTLNFTQVHLFLHAHTHTHTDKMILHSPKWFLCLDQDWTSFPKSNFLCPCPALVTCGWHLLATNVVFMPCRLHTPALLLWGMLMHHWCAPPAPLLSIFGLFFPIILWLCCQSSNGNLRSCIDCWWWYCLSTGLVAPPSGWKYLIKQSAASLWYTDANK